MERQDEGLTTVTANCAAATGRTQIMKSPVMNVIFICYVFQTGKKCLSIQCAPFWINKVAIPKPV